MKRKLKRASLAAAALCFLFSLPGISAEVHVAAAEGDVSRLEYVLARDPDMANARDREGVSPLHYAASGGHEKAVLVLLEKGAKIDANTFSGATPLYLASAKGRTATVRLLIENGAAVNNTDKMGCIPLHAAAGNGHIDTVKLLIKKGARPEETCRSLNPAELAYALGHDEIADYLKTAGAAVRLGEPEVVREIGRLRQSEIVINLQELNKLQHAFHEKRGTFAASFEEIAFETQGNTRHALFLPGDSIQPRLGGPFRLSASQRSMLGAGEQGFTALAAGNVDNDAAGDVWLVNDAGVKNVEDDVEEGK